MNPRKPLVSENVLPTHGGFMPAIEGLRAMAVLVVLLFHLDVPIFGQGYLGVDLFFIISGYIITRNIIFDVHANKFSLKEFYFRRFWRLFPALITTILVTLVAAFFVMPPLELAQTGKSALYALFSLANFNFLWEADYFDAAAHTKPLLHTWSLSVEEQFYLFWPALLLLVPTNRLRVILCAVLLIVSVISSIYFRDAYASAVFYMLPFRVHQLMAGALLAFIHFRMHVSISNIIAIIATSVFVAICLMSADQYTPAVNAVVITAVGFFLILARDSWISLAIYGNPIMQWIGRRSYAIYLVHWPVIVLYKYAYGFELSGFDILFLSLVTLVLAIALHEGVENRFRRSGSDSSHSQKFALPVSMTALFTTLFLAANLWGLNGLPERVDPEVRNVLDTVQSKIKERKVAIQSGKCNLDLSDTFANYAADKCAYIESGKKNVLVIGDSFGADAYMMLSQTYDKTRVRFSQATASGCKALNSLRNAYPACMELNQYRLGELMKLDWDAVVLASYWTASNLEHLVSTVEALRDSQKKLIVFGPRPKFDVSVPLFISMQSSMDSAGDQIQSAVNLHVELLEEMHRKLPDVEIIDLAAVQCNPRCEIADEHGLLYYDEHHYTKRGAKVFGQTFWKKFNLWKYLNN